TWVKAQRLTGIDFDQVFLKLELLEFVVVGDARKVEPINFFVLADQGIVGRPEHWVPCDAAEVPFLGAVHVPHRAVIMQTKHLAARGQREYGNEPDCARYPYFQTK